MSVAGIASALSSGSRLLLHHGMPPPERPSLGPVAPVQCAHTVALPAWLGLHSIGQGASGDARGYNDRFGLGDGITVLPDSRYIIY